MAGAAPKIAGDDQAACVLGVTSSYGGKRWRARLADSRLGLALAQRLALPEIVGRVMAGRGITLESADQVRKAGADGIAVISDILRAFNPEERTSQWLKMFRS